MITSTINVFEVAAASGTDTDYTFPYPIHKSTDLLVYVNGAIKLIGDATYGHSITVAADKESALIQFSTAPALNDSLKFERELEYKQETDLANNSLFDAESLETSLDNIVMQVQQVGIRSTDLVFGFDPGIAKSDYNNADPQAASTLNKVKADRADKALKFDANGDITVSVDDLDNTIDYQLEAKEWASLASGNVYDYTDGVRDSDQGSISAKAQATAAAASAASALTHLQDFQGQYHGSTSVTPSSGVGTGDLWFDSTGGVEQMKVYDGSSWVRLTPSSAEQTAINAVNADAVDIGKVAAIDGDVTKVADIDTDVTAVKNIGTNGAHVTTVAGISGNVTTVAGISSDVTGVAGISSAVTAVNSNATNINKVATIDSNVTTVAGIDANVTTVAGISSDVTSVAGDATDIGKVAAIDSDVTDVAAIDSNVTTVATAPIPANLALVAPIAANVTTVAGISGNVTTVAGISSDVTAVAGDATDIGTVAGISGNVTTVAGISANVTTVAGISANVTTVAGNNTNVTTVATNMGDVHNFADLYQIDNFSPSAPTTDGGGVDAIAPGDLAYDSTANVLKVWNGSVFAAISSVTILSSDSAPELGGNLDVKDKLITTTTTNGHIAFDKGITEKIGSSTASTTVITVDLSTGNFFEVDLEGLSGNVLTFTISNTDATSSQVSNFVMKITQGTSTTTRNFTWSTIVSNGTNIDWGGGTGPDITTGADKIDILSFTTYNNGTTWYGAIVGQDFS